jgi:small subunit ribosomal protein S17
VERKFLHSTFKKIVKESSKYQCHDEKNTCHVGDFISMREVRPLSKNKRWCLVEVIKKSESEKVGQE